MPDIICWSMQATMYFHRWNTWIPIIWAKPTMWPIGQKWFNYDSPNVWCISSKLKEICWLPAPAFFLIANILWVVAFFIFIQRGGIRKSSPFILQIISLITLFWFLNASFSIFANIIVLRYQIFPMIVLIAFSLLFTSTQSTETNAH
jgi:hypothetical protein